MGPDVLISAYQGGMQRPLREFEHLLLEKKGMGIQGSGMRSREQLCMMVGRSSERLRNRWRRRLSERSSQELRRTQLSCAKASQAVAWLRTRILLLRECKVVRNCELLATLEERKERFGVAKERFKPGTGLSRLTNFCDITKSNARELRLPEGGLR
eukprot:364588-Chlamydomonas_euryale.AAC.25